MQISGSVAREWSITQGSTTRIHQQLIARLALPPVLPCLAFGTTANGSAHYTGPALAISLPKAAYNGWILPAQNICVGCAQIMFANLAITSY